MEQPPPSDRISKGLPGPTLILLGGIHGNEPAGVLALRGAHSHYSKRSDPMIRGEVVFLAGNTRALLTRTRYVDEDLNRRWTAHDVRGINAASSPSESLEQQELLAELRRALRVLAARFTLLICILRLPQGVPLATVGDTLRNRRFAMNFPATIILGRRRSMGLYLNA